MAAKESSAAVFGFSLRILFFIGMLPRRRESKIEISSPQKAAAMPAAAVKNRPVKQPQQGARRSRKWLTVFRAVSLKEAHGAPRLARATAAVAGHNALTQQLKFRAFPASGAAQERINGCVFFTQHLAEIGRKGL
jgi:hypothetical protein